MPKEQGFGLLGDFLPTSGRALTCVPAGLPLGLRVSFWQHHAPRLRWGMSSGGNSLTMSLPPSVTPNPFLASTASPTSTAPRPLGMWMILRALDEAAGVIVASTFAAMAILVADRVWRPAWDFSWADHWEGAPVLYLATAALMGVAWINVRLVQQGASRRFAHAPRRRDWVRATVVAVLAGVCVIPLARETFSGPRVHTTWLGQCGPVIVVVAAIVVALLGTLCMWRLQRRVAHFQFRLALTSALGLFVFAWIALWVDMTLYVGLYAHLHDFLEFSAFCLFFASFQLLGFVLVRRWRANVIAARIISAIVLLVLVSFASIRSLRTWTDARLAHAWVDEFYVGRAVRRLQQLELGLSHGGSLHMARIEQLARRFDIQDRHLDPAWFKTRAPSMSYPGVKNVVFFYVDTLRADVASEAQLMPHFAEFQRSSLNFQRAYATGSDTLRSLPTITSGNYFIDRSHAGDLLRLGKSGGQKSVLVVAKSASEFLQKLLPSFRFDELRTVQDYDDGEDVWGYGAHRSTAVGVGDEGVAFLKSEAAREPFFLWLFHFDVHAWRELDDDYIQKTRERFGFSSEDTLNLRYRTVARAVDEQFGRLLQTLSDTGRDEDTAVVFLSDHGEGLGQGGFWVHSIFLWESLVHVPLAVRIPGIAAGRVDTPVSLLDLAPTLAPIFGGGAALYHGENLTEPKALAKRRLPILLRGGKFSGLDRAGILDHQSRRKLVIRLEAAFPELHAYETDRRDQHNLARNEPEQVRRLLKVLAKSPVFPRNDRDFEAQAPPAEPELESPKAQGGLNPVNAEAGP